MATFTWDELIDRARVYVDDDHAAEDSWIAPDKWLTIGFAELQQQYRRWMRDGLVTPTINTSYLRANSTTIDGVLAVIGVGIDLGNTVRVIPNAQALFGRSPYWRGSSQATGTALSWAAHGTSDAVSIELDPVVNDLTYSAGPPETGNYLVRWIGVLTKPTATTDSVDLPDGADERLVLGMARRAHVKDSANSQLLQQLIADADAELKFVARGKVGGVRVRRTPFANRATRLLNPYRSLTWPGPTDWRYF